MTDGNYTTVTPANITTVKSATNPKTAVALSLIPARFAQTVNHWKAKKKRITTMTDGLGVALATIEGLLEKQQYKKEMSYRHGIVTGLKTAHFAIRLVFEMTLKKMEPDAVTPDPEA
tara:strand:- start:289 stop:639 length:351 start_codon:yes stop_codon:yes gene_type:complete